jgi:transcriptional regulator with XRE-family HTH domain
MRKKKYWNINNEIALSALTSPQEFVVLSHSGWIKVLRQYLRMTQQELAERAQIHQSHLAEIESGKVDPQIGTLRKIFHGLSCDLEIRPRPQKPLAEVLRGRARSIALKRLKHTMGTMALEEQAPQKDAFRLLLEKHTDDILNDPRERLWARNNE